MKKRNRVVSFSRIVAGKKYKTTISQDFYEGSGWGSTSAALKVAEMEIALQVAADVPDGEAFSWLRRVVGLSAKHVAGLLRKRPETISRWENGEVDVDWAAWVILVKVVKEAASGERAMLTLLEAVPA